MDIISYALSHKYTDESIAGVSGVLKGANCEIESIVPIEGGNRITFKWKHGDLEKTDYLDVMDGKGSGTDGYTKEEVDNLLIQKLDKENPNGTGSFSLNRMANTSIADYSFTEGYNCEASGDVSHAEGYNTIARSNYSHAEGWASRTIIDSSDTETFGHASHAEGSHTIAKGAASHAEGNTTESNGMYSHAEGAGSLAGGIASHAEGNSTVTNNYAEHAEGSYNKSTPSTNSSASDGTLHSVGIGNSMTNRKNAFEIMQNGNAYLLGVGNYDGTNPTEANTIQDIINNKDVVFISVPAEEDWEDETVASAFYNEIMAAINAHKFVVAVEYFNIDFDCWIYYTITLNRNDASAEDECLYLINFDGDYCYSIEVSPTYISKVESEIKAEELIEYDKTDIATTWENIFNASFINSHTPVLREYVGREHYSLYWKFINEDPQIGAYVFLANKNGNFYKLTITENSYREDIISSQVSEMPNANERNLGQIVQYTGTTNSLFTTGYFYKCIQNGSGSSVTYQWQNISVQTGGSATFSSNIIPVFEETCYDIIEAIEADPDTYKQGSIIRVVNDVPISGSRTSRFENKYGLEVFEYDSMFLITTNDEDEVALVHIPKPYIPPKDFRIVDFPNVEESASITSFCNEVYQVLFEDAVPFVMQSIVHSSGAWLDYHFLSYNGCILEGTQVRGYKFLFYDSTNNKHIVYSFYKNGTYNIQEISCEGQIIQVETLPSASVSELGKIYQFIGTSTSNYTNGYFYKCVIEESTYKWKNIKVQDGGNDSIDLDIGEADPSDYFWSTEYKTVKFSVPYGRGYDNCLPDAGIDLYGRADNFTGIIYNSEDCCIIKGNTLKHSENIKYSYIGIVNSNGTVNWTYERKDNNIKQYYDFPSPINCDINSIAFDKDSHKFKICGSSDMILYHRYINSENDNIYIAKVKENERVYYLGDEGLIPTGYYIVLDSETSFHYYDENDNIHEFDEDDYQWSEEFSTLIWKDFELGGLPTPEDDNKILISSNNEWIQEDKDDLLDSKQNKVIETTVADFDDAVASAEDGDLIVVKDADGGYDVPIPPVVNDKYLHTNATTGELEWSEAYGECNISIYDFPDVEDADALLTFFNNITDDIENSKIVLLKFTDNDEYTGYVLLSESTKDSDTGEYNGIYFSHFTGSWSTTYSFDMEDGTVSYSTSEMYYPSYNTLMYPYEGGYSHWYPELIEIIDNYCVPILDDGNNKQWIYSNRDENGIVTFYRVDGDKINFLKCAEDDFTESEYLLTNNYTKEEVNGLLDTKVNNSDIGVSVASLINKKVPLSELGIEEKYYLIDITTR